MRGIIGLVCLGFAFAIGCGDDGGGGASDAGTATGADAASQADIRVGGDTGTTGACETDLTGSWSIVSIEGAPSISPSASVFQFMADGTYSWCLKLAGYDLDGTGTWQKSGAAVAVDGEILNVIGSSGSPMTLYDCGADTFSFRDDELDAWTYARDAQAAGCQ